MKNRAIDIFDTVVKRVRESQIAMVQIGAINPSRDVSSGGSKRVGNRHAEFVSDFAKAGTAALQRHPTWAVRLQLFELFYVRDLAYKQVIAELRIKPGTMDRWMHEIKKAVGPELERRGIWPLRKYFSEPGWLALEKEAKDVCREDRRRQLQEERCLENSGTHTH